MFDLFAPPSETMERPEPKEEKESPRPVLPPRTKIICTIGPASANKETIRELLVAGMNVVRMNFSHGDHKYHGNTISLLREVMQETKRVCAILLDTKGPEIRTGKLRDGTPVALTKGQEYTIIPDPNVLTDNTRCGVTYTNIAKVVKPGGSILMSDGTITMTILEVFNGDADTSKHWLRCRVENNCVIGQTKGCNLPGVLVDLPAVTEKDVSDISFGIQQGVDFIAASFTRTADNVREIRKLLDSAGPRGKAIKIIAKIENQEGLDNFDEILEQVDGVMVARGDLGVEIPIEEVSIAQKMMIRKCNVAGKCVITATQMLESMIKNPYPTRAEASDVANAVFDGTDCVMLSGETANGSYPVKAVSIMAEVCREAEENTNYWHYFQSMRENGSIQSIAEAVASSAVKASLDLKASLVIVLTETGNTARLVAKYHPRAPILAVTRSEMCAQQCLTTRGLFPLLVDSMSGTESLIHRVIKAAKRLGFVRVGDLVVVVSGSREAVAGTTNDMRVMQVQYD